jgi:6-phosphogluconolactonase (cycloisomerase 2 family)
MKTTTRVATVGALAVAGLTLGAGPAFAAPAHFGGHRSAAVFVQTDNLGGNTVVAYDRTPAGALAQAGVYATGGLGGQLSGSVVDHLASEGSLAYDPARGLLYALNAGSNTVTAFAVHGDSLVRRQVITSGGTFPVSVAVHGNVVYVLNARGGGSLQGYVATAGGLVRVPAWNRTLGLNPAETPEFTSTPGQVAFTPDGSHLVVTTKGNGNSIDVFSVHPSGGLSAAPVVTVEPNAVPFGVTFDAGGHLVVAEAGPNAVATFSIERNGQLAPLDQVSTGQAATCWVTAARNDLYASNAGSASLSGYQDNGRGTLSALGNTTTAGGTVDAAATPDGRELYVQTGAGGIVDAFRVGPNGSLAAEGSVTVPGGAGGEGIVAL